MADDFVAHREFKLNDDVELVAEKRYNEREDIKPSKNAKKYNYTVVWDDKTDENKDKKEEKSTPLSDVDAVEKLVQETKESVDCEIDGDIDPESEFEIERQESDQIDDYTTRQRPLNDKGFPINYDDITEDDIPGDREAFKKKAKTYGSYTMSPVEYLRLEQFRKDHHDCQVSPDGFSRFGAIGGGTVVSFVGTGLGPIVHVKCEHCGTEVDLTDSDSW